MTELTVYYTSLHASFIMIVSAQCCVDRTPLGRARAWLRLALMQKKLADYFRLLVDNRDNIL